MSKEKKEDMEIQNFKSTLVFCLQIMQTGVKSARLASQQVLA